MLSDRNTPAKLVGNAAVLYTIVMRLTTLDTKSTNKSLCDQLKDLPTVAVTLNLNGDIDAIHAYFNDTYSQLQARGEDVDDKEDLLFAAYANVPDGKFQSYMEKKESDWYEDVNDMQGKDWKDIMKKAKEKYDLLKMDTHYKWGTPSLAEQKVIALQAQLADLKLENLQILKKLKGKLKDGDKKEEAKDGKKKNKKDNLNKKKQKKDEAWKKVPPKAGEAKSKEQGERNGIGVSIIKHGASICQKSVNLARNCRQRQPSLSQTRLKSMSHSAHQALHTQHSLPIWPIKTMSDGSDRHGS